jgi:hypothetical protein
MGLRALFVEDGTGILLLFENEKPVWVMRIRCSKISSIPDASHPFSLLAN